MKAAINLTVRRCTAPLSRNRLVVVGTIAATVRHRVFVAIPTSDAALLIAGACTVLPLSVAPSTMVFVFALSVFDGSWVGALGGRLDVTIRAGDISR